MSLPEGPGSLEGVGENVDINANMGTMSYGLGVELPSGYPEMTPSVGLSYNSGNGNSLAGVGWNMATPTIERMTNRGLPEYTDNDLFAANGGSQLVQISDGEPAIYRTRFEGGFVRYKWFERGAGDGGYWVAEMPDGMVEYYGATEAGIEVDAARVGGDAGVFRYHLVEKVDVYGHRIRYQYRKLGTATVPIEIGYVFVDGDPRFKVEFEYEDRPDLISDLKAGFVEVLESRLSAIRVLSGGIQLGRWALSYEPSLTSGGMSRLARAERFGLQGGRYPVVFNFEYSRSLGALCTQDDCGRPRLVEMGQNLGFNFQSGNVTLIDINGDALPDILETPVDGNHRFLINRFTTERQFFDPQAVESTVGISNNHLMRAGNVQVLDVDGDGFADLLNTRTGEVLENKGEGDWTRSFNLFDNPQGLPDLGEDIDPDDGDLESIRFFDFDNDKRIDILRSTGQGDSNITNIYRNLPQGGFEVVEGIDTLDVGFESERLQMSDMNGDGLLDLLLVNLESVSFRLNMGRGRWTDWMDAGTVPFTSTELVQAEMEDLNNDGLTDIVVVKPNEIKYALGVNGTGFGDAVVIDSASLGDDLPVRDSETTVLFADMNGNGSSDIVWTTINGDITFLEMFTVQPNLLSRIDNSIGYVQTVTYGSSVEQAARDAEAGNPWQSPLPHAMTVVTYVNTIEAFANIPDESFYSYTNGFYDGDEKAFRGFANVLLDAPGDETSEASRKRLTFDLGQEASHRAGLELEMIHEGANGRIMRIERKTFDDCPLAGIPNNDSLDFPIRFVCMTRNETIAAEGAEESDWVTVTAELEYDGYGNIVLESLLGITDVGGGGCEPCEGRDDDVQGRACGPQCLGDEQYKETTFITPDNTDDRWILRAPSRVRGYGRPGSDRFTERKLYYDGDPFVGLPEGELSRGAVMRVTQRINTDGDVTNNLRYSRDAHGNVLDELNPNGSPDNPNSERRAMAWDTIGLNPVSADVYLVDENDAPYTMRQEIIYDDLWNKPTLTTDWVVFRDGQPVTPTNNESVSYDEFGRFDERYFVGDNSGDPSERLTYELEAPVSRVIFNTRVQQGQGELDKVTIRCFDGKGRKIQERTQLDEGTWSVSEYTVYNTNGSVRRIYTAHTSPTGDCNAEPPEGTGYKEVSYDALGRQTRNIWVTPQGTITERFVHGPTTMLRFDFEDTDPDSPHFDTPTRHDFDGLGRRVGIARFTTPTDAELFELTYDELSNFRGTIDPQGNAKIQTFDESGRLIRVDDPDRGVIEMTLDANGKIIRELDAEGRVTENSYDSLGRMTARRDTADPEGTLIEFLYDFPRNCPIERCTNTASKPVEVSFPDGEGRGGEWFGYNVRKQTSFHGMEVRERNFEFLYEFDNLDRVISRTFPDNTVLNYEWDTLRLTAIPGIIDAFVYGDNGLISEIQYTNGTNEARQYDGRLRLTDQITTGPNDAVLMSRGYTYDHNGNITQIKDDQPISGMASAEARYTYDNLGRLTQAHLDPVREGFDELLAINYDSIDNITGKVSSLGDASAAHVGQYTYDAIQPHAVTQAGDMDIAYDATGATVQRGEQTFDWDAFGRISQVRKDGEAIVTNTYGSGFQRLLKETNERRDWTLTEHFEIRDGVASIHIIDGTRRLAQLDSLALAPLVLSDLAPLAEQDGALVPDSDAEINAADAWVAHATSSGLIDVDLGDETADPSAHLLNAAVERLLTDETEPTFFHSDLSGVAMSTNADGEVIGRAVYHPYGQLRDAQGSMGDYGYGNKERDHETDTIYYGARHLDPWLGRWLSPDPAFRTLQNSDIQHLAEETGAYVAMINNPTSSRDADGRLISLLASTFDNVAGAIIGGATGFVLGAMNSMVESRIQGYGPVANITSALLGGLTRGATGAAYGAASGLISTAVDMATSGVTTLTHAGMSEAGATTQNQITGRRVASALTTFAIGAAIGAATIATGGLALGVLALAGSSVVLGAKLWAIHKAHKDGFSKALFRKFGINKVTRLMGKTPEAIFTKGEISALQSSGKKPGGNVTFSTSSDGDIVVKKTAFTKPNFKKQKSKGNVFKRIFSRKPSK